VPHRRRSASDTAAWRSIGTKNERNRDEWVAAALAQVPAGRRLLDAGAGEQRYRKACEHLVYVSQDFAQYKPGADATGLYEQRWDYGNLDIISDITAIPEPDGSFDAVLCTEVFEHIPDPTAALREFARLLRPGGELILTAPFASLTHQAPYHFSTGFSRYYYEHHLSKARFRIIEMTPNGSYFEYVAQEIRRLPEMSRRYANKRVSPLDLVAGIQVLRLLARVAQRDNGSSGIAAFGFHVRAIRLTDSLST
jgi:ubiquinone/menaquinone biosynthesis C-methylase UbiE